MRDFSQVLDKKLVEIFGKDATFHKGQKKQCNSGNVSYDAYTFVFPIIKELILSNDKITIEKLANFLNLENQQAKIWYERAIQDMHLPFPNDIHQNSLPKTMNTFTQSSLFE
ncbi:hypothetical protein BWGOE3_52600 [Bacillus mycoides]|uniref:hypothetical protein n=1 Tax=Bacillus cereus group TaxID=86661 RepID=UPI000872AFE6|nr:MULTISPECIES: hypothetical protein [Bacillus cereus group]MBJ8072260.1 hypothetical protein [Bacillus cereus]MDM5465119.1 hypothetical protein [Bacillus cereus]OFD38255.1 hypothetical protein BWGOE3_52600 [Bacillus mycoides]OFD40653.1 hypothetical protein BWGOE1_52510 [Bacillus mycoides]OFD55658.1 hypothetical protein BWGOE6_52810 [Bacillus mycoides]